MAAGSIIQETVSQKSLFPDKNLCVKNAELATQNAVSVPSAPGFDGMSSLIKLEEDDCSMGLNQVAPSMGKLNTNTCGEELRKSNAVPCQQASLETTSQASPESVSLGSYLVNRGEKYSLNMDSLKLENDCHFVSLSLLAAGDDIDTVIDVDDGIVEHNQPSSSGMTDSSNGSSSMMRGSSSSSQSFEEQKYSKVKTSCVDSGSKIIVKATYREDTIRFKFEPSAGCFQLYEEVGKRFKLQNGTFQLKYLDDEEEWVMLVSDSDLQECLEILDDIGTRSVKLLVRDMPCSMNSSGSSNCFLTGGL
ncbi:protein NLP8 [Quercus suber]|uniref:protein NLP8 n=1 Tax=Quercus suber TaxID=58331 RepID=UPI0032DEB107